MRIPFLLSTAALLLAGSAARAEGPVGPGHESGLPEDLAEASRRVSRALKENEEALARIARGEAGEAKPVDISLPPPPPPKEEAAKRSADSPAGGGGAGGAGGQLQGSEEKGKAVVAGIDDLLRIAARMSKKSGGGGGGGSGKPEPGDGEGGKPRNQKQGPGEKSDAPKDSGKDGSGTPNSGEKSKTSNAPKDAARPVSPKRPPTEKEMAGVFLARLPDKVREAVLNGDFDQVPERYRDLIREWTTALQKADEKEAGPDATGESR